MYLLGYDIGSSSVKASLLDIGTGRTVVSDFYPKTEMAISAPESGWAEQDPELWWRNIKQVTTEILKSYDGNKIKAIGISYQMHGLVAIDENKESLRPSIIWCDSRAVKYGDRAFENIGEERCLSTMLNSPGNFTASKLKWVKDNEPDIYSSIWKVMLPGDYIAMKLTGEVRTTIPGLSEGILWDFKNQEPSSLVLEEYGIEPSLLPELIPVFANQGLITESVSKELGIPSGIPVTYRAGDQPNNAFSLNVLNPGEIAATAGTSGVVYGVSDEVKYDPESRVNTFAHVNYRKEKPSLGVLLCINGAGILYSWIRKTFQTGLSYEEMNKMAATVEPGSKGLKIFPFGNGAERMLKNIDPGSIFHGLNFNIHNMAHLIRAAQEGIAFSFFYGMKIMKKAGIDPAVIRAGNSNMFLSPVFRNTLANISQSSIELYETDGSAGAARGAGIGAGFYKDFSEAFRNLKKINTITPDSKIIPEYKEAYSKWESELDKQIKQ